MNPDPIAESRLWIERIVIGLNLCPFAGRVFRDDTIRFTISDAASAEGLLDDLSGELRRLIAEPIESIETAILIHPHVLQDFLDYNDFLARADERLAELALVGVVQIASFHPQYRFAGTKPDSIENFTNRSPYPMLHLLREESISKVADDPEFLAGIPTRNIAALRKLGMRKLKQLFPSEPQA